MTFDKEKFILDLKEMKVSELNDLVKAIEEEFGVTAASQVVAQASEASGEDESKNLVLKSAGQNKIAVIKLLREIMGLGLMEAKTFAENGGVVKEDISGEELNSLSSKFKEIGAEVVAE